MPLEKTFIPYGGYWSTPFCRWQGALAGSNSIELAADVAKKFLASRDIAATTFDSVVLGHTVMQKNSFYGAPWLAGMIGASGVTGPNLSQACATSARAVQSASLEVEAGVFGCELVVTADRCSNGPHVYYPNPNGMGGTGQSDNPVVDSFNKDPHGGTSMLETAENVAREAKISREEQDEMTLIRHGQYQAAVADDRAFQRRYMLDVDVRVSRKKTIVVSEDDGVHPTDAEGLQKLRPVLPDGTVTFGGQTFPADGNAGIIIADEARAASLSKDSAVKIRVRGFGSARVDKAMMPMAVVPAARAALAYSGLAIGDMKAVKTHNPFAVNDVFFSREMGLAPEAFNNFGSPLIFGHPQGPTGLRVLIELIEEIVQAGGGKGLFSGCAAGDTAMAVVVEVG